MSTNDNQEKESMFDGETLVKVADKHLKPGGSLYGMLGEGVSSWLLNLVDIFKDFFKIKDPPKQEQEEQAAQSNVSAIEQFAFHATEGISQLIEKQPSLQGQFNAAAFDEWQNKIGAELEAGTLNLSDDFKSEAEKMAETLEKEEISLAYITETANDTFKDSTLDDHAKLVTFSALSLLIQKNKEALAAEQTEASAEPKNTASPAQPAATP